MVIFLYSTDFFQFAVSEHIFFDNHILSCSAVGFGTFHVKDEIVLLGLTFVDMLLELNEPPQFPISLARVRKNTPTAKRNRDATNNAFVTNVFEDINTHVISHD